MPQKEPRREEKRRNEEAFGGDQEGSSQEEDVDGLLFYESASPQVTPNEKKDQETKEGSHFDHPSLGTEYGDHQDEAGPAQGNSANSVKAWNDYVNKATEPEGRRSSKIRKVDNPDQPKSSKKLKRKQPRNKKPPAKSDLETIVVQDEEENPELAEQNAAEALTSLCAPQPPVIHPHHPNATKSHHHLGAMTGGPNTTYPQYSGPAEAQPQAGFETDEDQNSLESTDPYLAHLKREVDAIVDFRFAQQSTSMSRELKKLKKEIANQYEELRKLVNKKEKSKQVKLTTHQKQEIQQIAQNEIESTNTALSKLRAYIAKNASIYNQNFTALDSRVDELTTAVDLLASKTAALLQQKPSTGPTAGRPVAKAAAQDALGRVSAAGKAPMRHTGHSQDGPAPTRPRTQYTAEQIAQGLRNKDVNISNVATIAQVATEKRFAELEQENKVLRNQIADYEERLLIEKGKSVIQSGRITDLERSSTSQALELETLKNQMAILLKRPINLPEQPLQQGATHSQKASAPPQTTSKAPVAPSYNPSLPSSRPQQLNPLLRNPNTQRD